MFPLTPDQHHWLEVATEDEGWCSFTSCTPSRSRARMKSLEHMTYRLAVAEMYQEKMQLCTKELMFHENIFHNCSQGLSNKF